MNKITKGLLVVMAAILMLTSCVGGSKEASEKEFSKEGMTITLTEDFAEKEMENQTAAYISHDSMVIALKEEFTLFEKLNLDPNEITLEKYFEMIEKNNNSQRELKEEDGLKCFSYDKSESEKELSCFGVVLKGKDAFWLVQFSCDKKNFDNKKADFIKWAKSIKIDN